MAARASTLRTVPAHRSVSRRLRPAPRVVAEILEDGTVRTLAAGSDDGAWTSKTVSGPDWTIWLERRSWSRRAPRD